MKMKPTDTTLNKDFVQGPDKPEPPFITEEEAFRCDCITFNIADIREPEKRNGHLTKTITIPGWEIKD